MAHSNLSRKIENYIGEIPSLPVSVAKVMEICNNTSARPSDLNRVISLDPVLTGRLLKLINCAYYGLGTHVTSLVKAITMLGINTVKNLALSSAILSTLPKNKKVHGLDMEGFWRHCLCVGVTSKFFAEKRGIDSMYLEEYFTAGLLHDIGKIPLNAVLSGDYLNAVTMADGENMPLFESENENFGINHSITGKMIAGAWKLERPVTDVIAHHHEIGGYSGENLQIICNVAIANYFALVYGVGFSGDIKPVKPEKNIWATVGIKEDSFDVLKEKIYGEIEKAKIFLRLS
jgi:putative nucleotidyltransferase with HDIG domain